jgi:hypothetical protein
MTAKTHRVERVEIVLKIQSGVPVILATHVAGIPMLKKF